MKVRLNLIEIDRTSCRSVAAIRGMAIEYRASGNYTEPNFCTSFDR